MLEVLQFIFSSPFVWAGTVVLVSVFGAAIGYGVAAVRG